jgi:hypothetical protein
LSKEERRSNLTKIKKELQHRGSNQKSEMRPRRMLAGQSEPMQTKTPVHTAFDGGRQKDERAWGADKQYRLIT